MLSTRAAPSARRLLSPILIEPACRLCGARLHRTLIDLGRVPLANRTLAALTDDDERYPLRVNICDDCGLVQTEDVTSPERIATPVRSLGPRFADDLNQAKHFAEIMRRRLKLAGASLVIEVGSGDGYRLQDFRASGIPVLGIKSAPNAAAAAIDSSIPTETATLNTETAMEIAVRFGCADLVIANDILQHAPDLFDFAAALGSILRPNGVLTLQVPHLLPILETAQFDAFRHDAYSYLSLHVLEHVLRAGWPACI